MRLPTIVRHVAVCCIALFTATAAKADGYPTAVPLAEDAVREDIALARDALEAIHPGYTRYVSKDELDAAWERLDARAGQLTDVELYVALSALTERLRCDHTKLELPERLRSERNSEPSFFPFRTDVFEGEFVILSVAAESGFEVGDRVLSIDGRPMYEIAEAIYSLLPVDGRTDHVKPDAFVESGDFGTSGFEHFYPLHFGAWSMASVLVERGEERVEVTATPIGFEEWRQLQWDGPVARADFRDSVFFDVLDGGVGYLRVDTFVNYRQPVDPRQIYGPIFERIDEAGIEALIIDTRRNGGGSDDAQVALMAYLLDEPFTLIRSKRVRTIDLSAYAEHIDTWDPSAITPDPATFTRLEDGWYELRPDLDPLTLQPAGPLQPNFDGRLYVLTSASNASAVTMMLATLRERADNVSLVGESTGGSSEGPTAGMIYFLRLPNSGMTLRIPWQLQRLNIDRPERGLGVTPDVAAPRTAEDALAGRDVALESALELARNGQISEISR